jgi:hypothetical protein
MARFAVIGRPATEQKMAEPIPLAILGIMCPPEGRRQRCYGLAETLRCPGFVSGKALPWGAQLVGSRSELPRLVRLRKA